MTRFLYIWLLFGCAVVLTAPGFGATMQEILLAKAVPMKLALKDLDQTWRRIRADEQLPASESVIAIAFDLRFGRSSSVFYSKGQTVTIGNETYLVAYHPPFPVQIDNEDNDGPPQPLILTAESPLAPALLRLHSLARIGDIKPFDLAQELAANQRFVAAFRQQNGGGQGGNKPANIATLKTNLQLLRNAIEQFQADTGAYPARLADLLLDQEHAPKAGMDAEGNPVKITQGYAGPYLPPTGGIAGAPGIPINPCIDLSLTDPDPTLVETHWLYQNGMLSVPEYMAGQMTGDGMTLGEL